MCELLGVSSNLETNIQYSLQSMVAHSRTHRHGWGVCFYPYNSKHCVVFKEAESMSRSGLLRFINENNIIRSKIILNHIRLSTTSQSYENTHPFYRELFGEHWSLIHNGASGMDSCFKEYLRENENQINYIPIGSTGSDKALCIILNELKKNILTEVKCENRNGNLEVVCNYPFETAQRVIYETCHKIMQSGAHLNILLSNGEYLFAFHSGYNQLNYVFRDQRLLRGREIRMIDADFQTIGLEKQPNERTVIVATEILTEGEEWKRFNKGDFLVFKDGNLVYKNGTSIEESSQSPLVVSNVEVYDSSRWLEEQRLDLKVIGIPKKLRDNLGVNIGERVIVESSSSSIELFVFETDKRLLKTGDSPADNPDLHACIPKKYRELLGLRQVISYNRNNFVGFRKKFDSVSISKA